MVQVCILQRSLRQHHENELEETKLDLGNVVCQQLQ